MPSETNPNLVWGGYPRISDDPNDQRSGVTRQREDIASGVRALGGDSDAIVWFEENNTSAYKKKKILVKDPVGNEYYGWRVIRPLWHDALHALRTQRINALMVWDLDRLARDPRDLEDAIEAVERYGAVIKSATAAELDLMTDAGQMTARLFILIANKSSADTSRRVKRHHLGAAREGKPVGGNRPFGFKKDKKEHDPVEVAVLRQVVDEILTGKSVRDVVAALNTSGVKTTTGREWTAQTLKQMLRSPRLAGWRVHQGNVALDKDGDPVRGQWEPVVDQDTWDRLQLMVSPRPDTRKRVPRRDARHYLLTGIVRCGICNAPLYGNAHTGGKYYYVCSPKNLPLDHGLGGSGQAIDRLVTAQVLLRLQDIDATAVAEAGEWAGHERMTEIAQMIREAMEELRKGTLSAQAVFPHVQALEAEQSELEEARVAYLAASHVALKGPVTPDEWEALSPEQKRTYIELLLDAVIVKPATRRGNQFDPSRLVYVWREAVEPARTPR